jgi:hypothetical protein
VLLRCRDARFLQVSHKRLNASLETFESATSRSYSFGKLWKVTTTVKQRRTILFQKLVKLLKGTVCLRNGYENNSTSKTFDAKVSVATHLVIRPFRLQSPRTLSVIFVVAEWEVGRGERSKISTYRATYNLHDTLNYQLLQE